MNQRELVDAIALHYESVDKMKIPATTVPANSAGKLFKETVVQ